MTAALDPQDFYRTTDMSMVTYLKLNDHPVQTVLWEGNLCVWYFRVTDKLLEDTEQYLEGSAMVEPRAYNKKYDETKRQFYETRPPRGQQEDRRPARRH